MAQCTGSGAGASDNFYKKCNLPYFLKISYAAAAGSIVVPAYMYVEFFKNVFFLKKYVVRPFELSFYPNTVLDAIDFGYSRNYQFLVRLFLLLAIGVCSSRGNSRASKYQICVFCSNNHDFC